MHPVVADDLSGGGPLRKSGLSRARLCLATKSLICDQTEGLRVAGSEAFDYARSRLQYFTNFPFHPEKLPLTGSQSAKIPHLPQRNPRQKIPSSLPPHNIPENTLRPARTNKSICSPHTRNIEQQMEKYPYLNRLIHRISPKILMSSVFANVTNTFNGKLSSSITFGPR